MWLLQYLPNWIFSALFFAGIILYLVTKTISFLPHTKVFQGIAVALIFFGTYMVGAVSNNDAWLKRVSELQLQISKLETKSQETNTKIVTKVLTKREYYREQGEEVIKYVDREIVKYDESCKIPPEVVEAHNKAAK
jgi:uncharacterized membrane protein